MVLTLKEYENTILLLEVGSGMDGTTADQLLEELNEVVKHT